MAFLTKTNYFSSALGTLTAKTQVMSDEFSPSVQTAEAQNEKGDIVAQTSYGDECTVSNEYALTQSVSNISDIKMGKPFSITGQVAGDFVLTSLTINTGAATPVSISASGEKVPNSTHTNCYYKLPTIAGLSTCHHAQNIFSDSDRDFTLTISGNQGSVYVTQANYTFESSLTRATVEGVTKNYDITGGKITVQLTLQAVPASSGLLVPSDDSIKNAVLTALGGTNAGWIVSSALTRSNGDASYPTYSIALSKVMTHAEPEQSESAG